MRNWWIGSFFDELIEKGVALRCQREMKQTSLDQQSRHGDETYFDWLSSIVSNLEVEAIQRSFPEMLKLEVNHRRFLGP